MASRVYWITARTVMNSTRRYIQRNQIGLEANLTTEQYNCVVAVLNAIITCLTTLPTPSTED
jgi:hypothetical protein